MATADRWRHQWGQALEGAKAGIAAFEKRCATEGIVTDADRLAADAELAISIVQCALLGGLPWTPDDGGNLTLERARHVLAIATEALNKIEISRN